MKLNHKITLLFSLLVFTFFACETEITIDLPKGEDQLVVESWIESGGYPFVILTRNQPFFGEINLDDISSLFVEDAIIHVSNGPDSMQLEPYNIELDSARSAIFYGPKFSDILTGNAIVGQEGGTYSLNIEADNKTVTGVTTIPKNIPIDSIWWEPRQDTMARIFIDFEDPDTLGNYYRYFTKMGDAPMYPGFASVFDDLLINGEKFDIPVDRGYDRFGEFDIETLGLFRRGDTATVRISAIDEAHYNFWLTMEVNAQSGGPFSSITVVDHTVEGGFGVWGGYNSTEVSVFVPAE